MTKLVAEELRKAVIKGFGTDLMNMDYDTPDYNMLTQLEKNVFHFSGAKNYQQLKSMSLALKDKNGLVRTFSDFKMDALSINQEYNGRNLATEFETAIGSGQMAGKWVDIEANKGAAPLLRYDTVGDSRVRPSHKILDGIIRPVDDSFWNTYYPPNGWNCRCDVTQLLHGTPTRADQVQTPDDVPAIFQTNLAKDGLVFPANHPYYIDCPAAILKQAETLINNVYSKITRTKSMNADVYVASLADKNDLAQNIQLSRQLAEFGEEVYIRPHTNETHAKNPELKIGGTIGDFKVDPKLTTIEKFVRNSIDGANKQACNIPVIVIDAKRYNKEEIWQALYGELKSPTRKKNISHVWLMLDKQLIKFSRAQIMKNLKDLLP
ncbi:phage minor head protein [Limnovirga soli]|uniref:Phage head morphogenesis domain-containing protein n=1 Tax=Limnovirga soli TaxID=2656915 RepID=A0A8J8FEL9_9BACT|nr:phage minor head protein [Limnovirga soli]NNV54541.1 hypothetical protein [Limnovirga soli]